MALSPSRPLTAPTPLTTALTLTLVPCPLRQEDDAPLLLPLTPTSDLPTPPPEQCWLGAGTGNVTSPNKDTEHPPGSSRRGSVEMKLTNIHEEAGSILSPVQWVKDSALP